MKDWDADLWDAADAAKRAAKTPLVKGILDLASRNETLSLAMSEAAAARLLYIAILCGNVEAATNLARTYQARPLRWWRGDEMDGERSVSVLSAALCAGADFEGLHVTFVGGEEVPLLRVVPLRFEPEQWQLLEQFFPPEKNQWPTCDLRLGDYFLEEDFDVSACVSMQKIQNAFKAGWDLQRIYILLPGLPYASLLDLSILCGQRDCAGALGSAGVELQADCLNWHRRNLRGDGALFSILYPYLRFGSASECQSAASAAARASLTTSFQREGAEKGIAVYQTLTKKFHPRGVPMALVRDILAFSMEVKILDQLDLWDEVRGWTPSWEIREEDDTLSQVEDLEVEEKEGSESAHDPGTLSICQCVFFVFFPLDPLD